MNWLSLIPLLLGLVIIVSVWSSASETKIAWISGGSLLVLVGFISLFSNSQSNFKYVNEQGRDYLGYDKYEDPEEEEFKVY
jgi:tetrahydromethanopterin S-methyltransferase subunit E